MPSRRSMPVSVLHSCIRFTGNKSMDHLPGVITAALTVPRTPLWLPNITHTLVEMGRVKLSLDTGITMLKYGTARVIANDASAPYHVVACLPFYSGSYSVDPHLLAECLGSDVAHRYQEIGLTFYTADEIANTTALNCLQEAIDILAAIPSLHRTIATLVRVCHLIKPADGDYDVSYSDPQVPFSIFLSVPQRRRAHDALRVAESIVHEAMHLQLTLIDQCLEQLLALSCWSLSSLDHMRNRRREIAKQVREIEAFKDSTALTTAGTRFVQRLIDG